MGVKKVTCHVMVTSVKASVQCSSPSLRSDRAADDRFEINVALDNSPFCTSLKPKFLNEPLTGVIGIFPQRSIKAVPLEAH